MFVLHITFLKERVIVKLFRSNFQYFYIPVRKNPSSHKAPAKYSDVKNSTKMFVKRVDVFHEFGLNIYYKVWQMAPLINIEVILS